MNGPKLNENVLALAEGQRATKAVARYVEGAAPKVRVVLDLIRGLPVQRADEVLQFADRAAAADVRKVLASAVANAVHNDAQDPEELFVLAAFADEGPTLKRFRPRARGRASRIRKRTSHITVVVARMSDERLEVLANRQASSAAARRRPGLSARSRAERVARSRQRAEGLRDAGATDVEETVVEEATVEETVVVDDLPAGAVAPPEDGSVPEGYPVKGNTNSMKYHEPGGRYYDVTIAELYFDTPASAEAAGYDPVAPPTGAAASDEADAARGRSEAEPEPATSTGSASDEADAARVRSAAEPEPASSTGSASDEADHNTTDETEPAEGSASDEADAARGRSEAEPEPASSTGSASDEADAARGRSAAAPEPADGASEEDI